VKTWTGNKKTKHPTGNKKETKVPLNCLMQWTVNMGQKPWTISLH